MNASERDQVLIDLCLGLRGEEEDAVQVAMRSEEGRERLAELRRVMSGLDSAGAESRTLLASLERMDSAPGEDRVEDVLRRLATESVELEEGPPLVASGAPAAFPWWTWLSAAAASVLAILVLQWAVPDSGPGGPRLLGGHALQIVAPLDGAAVEGALTFEWSGALGQGEEFRVRVYDGEDPLAFQAIAETRTIETRWTPRPTELNRLPSTIRWTVERMAPSGTVALESVEAFAQRSP